jgi:hypothetical protein
LRASGSPTPAVPDNTDTTTVADRPVATSASIASSCVSSAELLAKPAGAIGSWASRASAFGRRAEQPVADVVPGARMKPHGLQRRHDFKNPAPGHRGRLPCLRDNHHEQRLAMRPRVARRERGRCGSRLRVNHCHRRRGCRAAGLRVQTQSGDLTLRYARGGCRSAIPRCEGDLDEDRGDRGGPDEVAYAPSPSSQT